MYPHPTKLRPDRSTGTQSRIQTSILRHRPPTSRRCRRRCRSRRPVQRRRRRPARRQLPRLYPMPVRSLPRLPRPIWRLPSHRSRNQAREPAELGTYLDGENLLLRYDSQRRGVVPHGIAAAHFKRATNCSRCPRSIPKTDVGFRAAPEARRRLVDDARSSARPVPTCPPLTWHMADW